ncbi:MAG: DUF4832 domain-containing protein [Eubacteriales bacterium]|nr:DUF4832 domain-containing protein [Eubacteriales bacterium]
MRRMIGFALALALLLGASATAATVTVAYRASDRELVNPFIGSAAWANDDGEREQPFTLVYANLRWADFEPEEGVYDFAAFEEANHFKKWRAEGKRLILRFVLDVPGSKKHLDIPKWLYNQTKDGQYYKVSYGRGYCPDYANETLIAAHRRAVAALGARYDGDPFVAYVELGSLGHWGEWHVHPSAGVMPPETVRDRYAQAYTDAFTTAKLMMRRPFRFAMQNGLGLYNDTTGDARATETWLGWIANGGTYGETDEPDALAAMPEGWQTAPVGGELTTAVTKDSLLSETLSQTLALLERSHASWVGPGSFVNTERNGPLQTALDQVNRLLGYRLRVASAVLDTAAQTLTLTWANDGSAPFYFGWTPALRLTDSDGASRVLPLKTDLLSILPGSNVTETVDIAGFGPGAVTIDVGIPDPQTGEPGVALAMDAPEDGGWYRLMTVAP